MDDAGKEATRPRAASSSVALAAATAFIALASILSFFGDRPSRAEAWSLRGTLAPDSTGDPASRLPAASKPV